MQNTATTRPHCTKCGAYLDRAPDNAFGWCGACQAWAQMGGLRSPAPSPTPAEPVIKDTSGVGTYTWPLEAPDTTRTLHAPHC